MTLMRAQRHAGFSLTLALIILVAQLGAQAHAYTHLAGRPDSIQRHSLPAPCAECSAFAPLLAAVSNVSYPLVLAVVNPARVCSPWATGFRHAAACTAYRSRAPPLQS